MKTQTTLQKTDKTTQNTTQNTISSNVTFHRRDPYCINSWYDVNNLKKLRDMLYIKGYVRQS